MEKQALLATTRMNALAILYHDVVDSNFDESGFSGAAAARYKFTRTEFAAHLSEMVSHTKRLPVTVGSIGVETINVPLLFTVDDGGASAVTIADMIEPHGWRAHFFITTDFINTKAFLAATQIRELRQRGHVIGSHSCSHPFRFSELPTEQLAREWKHSVETLSNILGEPVSSASVPGGFYAARVAEQAIKAGITSLFTSEPTTRIACVAGCRVFGRFNLYRGMNAQSAAAMVMGKPWSLFQQKMVWEAKKALKTGARPLWDAARKHIFDRK